MKVYNIFICFVIECYCRKLVEYCYLKFQGNKNDIFRKKYCDVLLFICLFLISIFMYNILLMYNIFICYCFWKFIVLLMLVEVEVNISFF